jgi:hypothetical protein
MIFIHLSDSWASGQYLFNENFECIDAIFEGNIPSWQHISEKYWELSSQVRKFSSCSRLSTVECDHTGEVEWVQPADECRPTPPDT